MKIKHISIIIMIIFLALLYFKGGGLENITGNIVSLFEEEKSSSYQYQAPIPAQTQGEVIKSTKEYKIFIEDLPYNVDSSYSNSIREAISYWEKRDNVIFREVSSNSNADIRVTWVKEFGGEHLGRAINEGYVEIGIGDSFCLGKWQGYAYDEVLHIAKHELGHVLGYDHSDNPYDLMYYKVTTKYKIDIEETEIIPDGSLRFYPICTRNDIAEYSFEVSSTEPLDIYVVPSIDDFNKFKEKEAFSRYVDCSQKGVELYEKECTIESGSGIILYNPSLLGLGPDARFNLEVREL